MKLEYLILCSVVILGLTANAEDDHHNHQHGKNWEIGISMSSVWLEEEDQSETGVGIHLHFVKNFSYEGIGSQFGYGIGFEAIFGEGEHYTPSISLAFYPTKNTAIIISPGYEFAKHSQHEEEHEDHNSDTDFQGYEESFSMHYEFVYFVEFDHLHIGPVIGFSHNTEGESHYSVGIHIGY